MKYEGRTEFCQIVWATDFYEQMLLSVWPLQVGSAENQT